MNTNTTKSGKYDIAIAELLRLNGDRIYRFCYRLCGNAEDAEDITQDVFIAAYKGLAKFRGESSVHTWLYKIALFRCRAHKRLNKATPISWNALPNDTPGNQKSSAELIQRMDIDTSISRLPQYLREPLLLVKCEGLTCVEAASVLKIPVGTVKFRVHSAIKSLQAVLDISSNSNAGSPAEPDYSLPEKQTKLGC